MRIIDLYDGRIHICCTRHNFKKSIETNDLTNHILNFIFDKIDFKTLDKKIEVGRYFLLSTSKVFNISVDMNNIYITRPDEFIEIEINKGA